MKNIIISSNENLMWLGHEIHATRCAIIDMLIHDFIHESDIIVVRNDDKKFLYEKLFLTVLNYKEFQHFIESIKEKEQYTIIDLSPISGNPDVVIPVCKSYNFSCSAAYFTNVFKDSLLQINYCDDLHVSHDFVMIHHRHNYDAVHLQKICDTIFEINNTLHIVVFNNDIEKLKSVIKHNNITFISNLQLYATYLHNSRCKLFISEWSGGGQLSQYCYSGKIMYYFNAYFDEIYINLENDYINRSMSSTYDIAWDFKNPNNCEIKIYKNLHDLLDNLGSKNVLA